VAQIGPSAVHLPAGAAFPVRIATGVAVHLDVAAAGAVLEASPVATLQRAFPAVIHPEGSPAAILLEVLRAEAFQVAVSLVVVAEAVMVEVAEAVDRTGSVKPKR
jgi:hypothetical protein